MSPQEKDRRIADLIGMLQSSDSGDRLWAMGRLGRIGPRAAVATPWLIEALRDASPHVRKLAALALGDIGPAAHEAVPALRDLLADPNEAVQRRAMIALQEIEIDRLIPPQAA